MIRIPTFVLEGKKLPRITFSLNPFPSSDPKAIFSLLRSIYEQGHWCFDLPSPRHLGPFRELRNLTEEESLIGIGNLGMEEGVALMGTPLHRFEPKVISTVKKNLFPPQTIQRLKKEGFWNARDFFQGPFSQEVFTQKEIDRMTFDAGRFDKALSSFEVKETPFLKVGGKYGDWLPGLGRTDLIVKMASRVREAGFIPIFSSRWATFVLPKVKVIDFAAYAVPINRDRGLMDHGQACALIKKFDKPLISLDPLAEGKLLGDLKEAFTFLFRELRIHGAVAEIASAAEGTKILDAMADIPSLIPPRKT
jgi:hypothetical protein